MTHITQDAFKRAADFIWRNARLLDRFRFAYHFLDGAQAAVLNTLRCYQNQDGGFGNAIEPDVRCPDSTPIGVATSFYILDEIDGFQDAMLQPACDFLLTISTPQGGVPFTLPTINEYPHAPWWTADETNPPASINPSGDIAGLLFKHNLRHPWLEKAVPFCWEALNADFSGYHDIMSAVEFLAHTPDQTRAKPYLEALKETILRKGLVAYDRKEAGYIKFPLDWAPTPQHPLSDLFTQAQIEADLQAILDTQQEDGGWLISWPTEGAGIEAEWRGVVTISNLLRLRTYGWL